MAGASGTSGHALEESNILRQKLKNMRRIKGLTQKDVAKRLGICQATLSNFERGKTYRMHPATMEKLSQLMAERNSDDNIVPFDAEAGRLKLTDIGFENGSEFIQIETSGGSCIERQKFISNLIERLVAGSTDGSNQDDIRKCLRRKKVPELLDLHGLMYM